MTDVVTSWGWLTLLIGLALGVGTWFLLHDDAARYVINNRPPREMRGEAVTWVASSVVCVVVAYLAAWAFWRQRRPDVTIGEVATRINYFAFSAIALPAVAALTAPKIETQHRFFTLLLVAIVGVVVGVLAYRVFRAAPVKESEGLLRWIPALATAGIGVAYAMQLSHWSVLDHENLLTNRWDLAIYDNLLWNTSHGNFLGCTFCAGDTHLSSHFDPLLVMVTPFYMWSPRAETLLIFQSWWIASAVIPLYLLGARRLKSGWGGAALAAIFALQPAVHGINMYDFHSLAMAVPLIIWVIYLVDSGALWAYLVALALLLLTREDMSLLACFVGVYAILVRRPLLGVGTIVAAVTYFVLAKTLVMAKPDVIGAGEFVSRYVSMIPEPKDNLSGLVTSLVTNPVFALKTLFTPEGKLFYYAAILTPLLALPLLSGRKLVMVIYGLIFIGLADRRWHFSIHFQYSTVLVPVLLAAVPDGIARLSNSRVATAFGLSAPRLVRACLVAALAASVLTSYKFGVFWPNASFRGGWQQPRRSPRPVDVERLAYLKEVAAEIPREASVCATEHITPHISNRAVARLWPKCKGADYLFAERSMLKSKKSSPAKLIKSGKWTQEKEGHGLILFSRSGGNAE